jgi:hypothetical protein
MADSFGGFSHQILVDFSEVSEEGLADSFGGFSHQILVDFLKFRRGIGGFLWQIFSPDFGGFSHFKKMRQQKENEPMQCIFRLQKGTNLFLNLS